MFMYFLDFQLYYELLVGNFVLNFHFVAMKIEHFKPNKNNLQIFIIFKNFVLHFQIFDPTKICYRYLQKKKKRKISMSLNGSTNFFNILKI